MGLQESDVFTLLGNFFCSDTAGAECRSVFGLEGGGSWLEGAERWRQASDSCRAVSTTELKCLILTDQRSWSFRIQKWKDRRSTWVNGTAKLKVEAHADCQSRAVREETVTCSCTTKRWTPSSRDVNVKKAQICWCAPGWRRVGM